MADASSEAAAGRYVIPPRRDHESSADPPTTPTPTGRNGSTNGKDSVGTITNTSSVVPVTRYAIPDALKPRSPNSQFKEELHHSLRRLDSDYYVKFFRAELVKQLRQRNTHVSHKPSGKPEYVADTSASIAFINALAHTIERHEKPSPGVDSAIWDAQIERLLECLDQDYDATTASDIGHGRALEEYPDIHTTILWALETLRGRLHELKGSAHANISAEPEPPALALENRSITKGLFFWFMLTLLAAMLYWVCPGL
ncbi:hypothetical protein A1O7_06788 [Cladophialophora yegresii CBS 114405]|uniref:Uncharacterized protein n=1 Tax=Cladophialophora yegresii CBS 114405 TaxID=1182544 RepID=W9WD39_9EURO|nr:uncharacterized protein A1O7_06788 [Cladophialophora yegresii CBS 114405]EXJ56444.1 hypothetical protein A1O7_06788 [Cladophialophora yegresii CBS 114405]